MDHCHGCSEQTRITKDVGTWTNMRTGLPLSVMIVFDAHIVQLQVPGDDQHQLLLHPWVPTSLLLAETTAQHNDLLLVEKSTIDVTSASLRSWESLNFEALEALQSGLTKKAERLEKRCWTLHFFSVRPPAAAEVLSSLRTIEKTHWCSERALCGHWPQWALTRNFAPHWFSPWPN